MYFLVLLSLVAGAALGQEKPSEYSDCSRVSEITQTCSNAHLGLDQEWPVSATLENAEDLAGPKGDGICGDGKDPKMFFSCVFGNLTDCLDEIDTNLTKRVPVTETISGAIVDLCKERGNYDSTCYESKKGDFEGCVAEKMGAAAKTSDELSYCEKYETMSECLETHFFSECNGTEVVQAFYSAAAPRECADTSGAPRVLAALPALLATLALALATL